MNLADIVVLLLVALAVVLAVRSIIHTRRHGNSCCGGSGCCGNCASCSCTGCGKRKKQN